MLRGYSVAAVSSILAVMVTAFLETRNRDQALPEPMEAQRALLAFLKSVLDQWEKDVLPKANPTYRREFRELRWLLDQTIQGQARFGATPDRPH